MNRSSLFVMSLVVVACGKPEDGKDIRLNPGSGPYAVMPHPTDGSIWYTSGTFGGTPGFLRFDPKTKLSEFFALPKEAIGVRGLCFLFGEICDAIRRLRGGHCGAIPLVGRELLLRRGARFVERLLGRVDDAMLLLTLALQLGAPLFGTRDLGLDVRLRARALAEQ